LGAIGLYYAVKYLIGCRSEYRDKPYIIENDIKYNYEYGDRTLTLNDCGYDVNHLIHLLRKNDIVSKLDSVRLPNRNGKNIYTKKVKKKVRKMQVLMGEKRTGVANISFLTNLEKWKTQREKFSSLVKSEELSIEYDANMLIGMASLLVEKGYLSSYKRSAITSVVERNNIRMAYHRFLDDYNIPLRNTINKEILLKLYSLPSV
jgi:hypothetical protein